MFELTTLNVYTTVATVFSGIAAEPVKAGCSLLMR
jgi:hypothetical protein